MVLFIAPSVGWLFHGRAFGSSSMVVQTTEGLTIEIRAQAFGIDVPLPAGLVQELSGLSDFGLSQKLIKELVRTGSYRDVVIHRTQSTDSGSSETAKEVWMVSMRPQRTIYSLSISGLGLLDEEQYRRRLRSRPGQIFLEEVLDEDVQTLTTALQERGYPFAKVESVEARGIPNGSVVVNFVVNRGVVCRLSEVRTTGERGLLQGVTLPIELGAVCNLPMIRKNLSAEQERLRQSGYLEAKVAIEDVVYSNDQRTASLLVNYDKGPLTRIEAIDLATGAIKNDFVKSDGGISSFDLANYSEEDLRREVESFYRTDGYAQVKVTGPSRVELKSGDRIQRFFVQKGPRIVVGLIEFSGDRLPFSRSEALEVMKLSPGVLSRSIPYDERLLPDYRDSLQARIIASGYVDAQVDLPQATISRSGGTAKLEFSFRLGGLYRLGDLSLLGLPSSFDLDQSALDDILEIGDPISPAAISEAREIVRSQLIEQGYYYARVGDQIRLKEDSSSEKAVQLIFEVDAGPIVRIRNVYLEGENYGKGERIKLVSMLRRGEVFSPSRLELARRRVLKYELFSTVSIEAFDLSAIERRDTELDVVIRTAGRSGYNLALNPGYGSRNGYRFGVDFVRNELNESGLRFHANTMVSQDKEQLPLGDASQQIGRKISLGLTEPLLRIGQWVSPVDARILAGAELSNLSFETRVFETLEFSLRWRPTLFDLDFDFEGGLAREWSQTVTERLEPLEVINNPSLQIHELVFKGAFDSRDSVEWARKGMYHEVVTQHARFGLDSDVSYDRYTVATNFFVPFLSRWSHAFSVGAIAISDVTNKDRKSVTAPSSRRAALTGRAAVRGFPENGRSLGPLIWLDLAPRASDEGGSACGNAVRSIGATNVTYAKYELRYRTTYLSNMLGLAWFVDSGAAFFSDSEQSTIQRRLNDEIAATDGGSGSCQLVQARLLQPPDIGKPGTRTPVSYLRASYISSGLGLRFIVPNFAAISLDWGLPIQDPVIGKSRTCATIDDAERSDVPPSCLKRDRQDRLFGQVPFPGSFYFGVGATL